jgi:hypothetical protein
MRYTRVAMGQDVYIHGLYEDIDGTVDEVMEIDV